MAKKMKRRLNQQQEFEIMKLVLDKFLWIGFGIMGYGFYKMFMNEVGNGIILFIAGTIILLLFMMLIIKEYEIMKT